MLNEFLKSTVCLNAMGEYLSGLINNELDVLSPLRKRAIFKDDIPVETLSYYDNSECLAFIVDDKALKDMQVRKIEASRVYVPIFELDSFFIMPIELDWDTKLEKIFQSVSKEILEKETNIINDLTAALDVPNQFEILLAVRASLTSIYCNDKDKKMIDNYEKTKIVNRELAEEAKNEGFSFFEQIGVAAFLKGEKQTKRHIMTIHEKKIL